MNMFKTVKAKTSKEYFAALPKERREPMLFLDAFIRKAAPSLKPWFAYNMPGYGEFTYRNPKKELATWPVISLASQKQHISIYICAVRDGEYLAEKHKKELGKVSVGRSCIRLRKLEDVDLAALKKVIDLAVKHPGLVGAAIGKKKGKK